MSAVIIGIIEAAGISGSDVSKVFLFSRTNTSSPWYATFYKIR